MVKYEKEPGDDRYRALFKCAKTPMLLIDPSSGQIVDANDAATAYYGYPAGQLEGMSIAQINTLTREEIAAKMSLAQNREASGFHFKHRLASGKVRDVEVHSGPISFGNLSLLYSIVHDITERKETERLLHEREADLNAVLDNMPHLAWLKDAEGRYLAANRTFLRAAGLTSSAEVEGKTDLEIWPRELAEKYRADDAEVMSTRGQKFMEEKAVANGREYWVETFKTPIIDGDGRVLGTTGYAQDITEKKQKDELIWKQANFDILTGLPNRRLFRDRLSQEIKKSHRTGEVLALLFIDLDRFKEINDTMGHDMGDQLLVEAAQRIVQCVRETDTVARLGGDEFTVVLTGFDSRAHIERIAQNIINKLSRPFMLGAEAGYISASIGLTIYPDDATDMEGLLKNADQAMYGAKSMGRNRFNFFTAFMQREAQEKLALANDLRLALKRGELEVYYQPIVELASGRIIKAEALLRWKHRERGMVGPDQFIPLAEESGQIAEIGEWVFHEAVASVERWHEKFGVIIQISVNMSPVQFAGETKAEVWSEWLTSCGLPGSSIALEITEGMVLDELPLVTQHMQGFRNSGMEISIDDFGTGFSSFAYLRKFDIDYLKIDRSFISSLVENKNDQALAEAIIVMAHKLGIKTIAEGVETEQQRDLLISYGCDFVQGYLYSRPVPAKDFEKLLESQRKKRVREGLNK